MSKCTTLYFICRSCDITNNEAQTKTDSITEITSDEIQEGQVEKFTKADLVKSFQEILDEKIMHMESKVESLIESKLGEKIEEISAFNENNKTTTTSVRKAAKYSQISRGTGDFREIIQEARNEEKVQEKEQEKRLNNFIIHGLDEKGKTIDEIKENDAKIIANFLSKVGVVCDPKSITRLGKSTENKKRTLKKSCIQINRKLV